MIRYLDRRIIFSGVLLVIAGALLLALVLGGPADARFGGAVGLIALLVTVQIAILFYRPTDRSPFGAARAAFIAGDFAAAAAQLEALIEAKPSARGYTLLANTYRALGRLAEARTAIEQALALRPKDAYARYGLGRIEQAKGNFEEAAQQFDAALQAGSPANVACDLGYAEYFAGNREAALRTLGKTTRLLRLESYRLWLTNLILYLSFTDKTNISAQTALANLRAAAEGRSYWEAEAARHSTTAYGEALAGLLAQAREFPKDAIGD